MIPLSIIIPCYNSQETISECLTAIRASVFKDYELIVVDDHSSDGTAEIAAQFADKVIALSENKGSGNARKVGLEKSSAEIICFIDSDIVIKPQTISTIIDFFTQNPQVDAITGMLSKEHPHRNFFSQYKNLYMNYIFSLLPGRVTFLFSSICAIRKQAGSPEDNALRYTPDTEFGQQLFLRGKTIAFLKDLEVVHLKKYSALSFIKNDFRVPFSWARIFVRVAGWRQLGCHKTGYAHSPREQLASVVLMPLILSAMAASLFIPTIKPWACLLSIGWLALNIKFLVFLLKERGVVFFLTSVAVTLLDQLVMATGIICGLFSNSKRVV